MTIIYRREGQVIVEKVPYDFDLWSLFKEVDNIVLGI